MYPTSDKKRIYSIIHHLAHLCAENPTAEHSCGVSIPKLVPERNGTEHITSFLVWIYGKHLSRFIWHPRRLPTVRRNILQQTWH